MLQARQEGRETVGSSAAYGFLRGIELDQDLTAEAFLYSAFPKKINSIQEIH